LNKRKAVIIRLFLQGKNAKQIARDVYPHLTTNFIYNLLWKKYKIKRKRGSNEIKTSNKIRKTSKTQWSSHRKDKNSGR
jgi:hypothetical protein